MRFDLVATFFVAIVLCACAATPRFDTTGIDLSFTPESAKSDPSAASGRRVLWGGVILETKNLESTTQIEVVAYPLRSSQRPNTNTMPIGRFFIQSMGYLEARDYAPGREVTMIGKVKELVVGRIGEYEYRYPVVISDSLHLWSVADRTTDSGVHFGVGISFIK